ncbi:geranylgeranyl diphosphate reductase [soil metagenome]
MNASVETFDIVVVGGGPAGATAAHDLAGRGHSVLLLDRAGRVKPCGGAIPPRLIKDFEIPDELLVAKARSARMVAPSDKCVDIPIDNGFVGMVDRDAFDEWLRARAASAGAVRRTGSFDRLERDDDGVSVVHYQARDGDRKSATTPACVRARSVIGADGARSRVAAQAIPRARETQYVFAYHEIVRAPAVKPAGYDDSRCDVYYQGALSPDFYGWVFPHGDTLSIGTGSADKGFSLRTAVGNLRTAAGLAGTETLRREGAPLPMKPLPRWDNGRDVVIAGDAAGVVAPASGEGIYYAMASGRMAGEAVEQLLTTGDARCLRQARKQFMKAHGTVFRVLGVMQWFWYSTDRRRERFVKICEDRDVQQLTFESYMNKQLTRKKPMAHVRIFFKDMAHLLGMARV